jgi:hypothetical protein
LRNHEIILCYVRARTRLARLLHDLAVRLGGPTAYYDGVPAAALVDDVVNELETLGVPRADPRDPTWALKPHERIRLFLIHPARVQGLLEFTVVSVQTATVPQAPGRPAWWPGVIEGRPAQPPGRE